VMGYAGAYLVTTLTLDWQLKDSIERLLMQVFPSVLFLVFAVLQNPLE
jgi:hypothetical protein